METGIGIYFEGHQKALKHVALTGINADVPCFSLASVSYNWRHRRTTEKDTEIFVSLPEAHIYIPSLVEGAAFREAAARLACGRRVGRGKTGCTWFVCVAASVKPLKQLCGMPPSTGKYKRRKISKKGSRQEDTGSVYTEIKGWNGKSTCVFPSLGV